MSLIGKTFYLKSKATGLYVHPQGGTAKLDTYLLFHPGKREDLLFQAVNGGQGRFWLKSKSRDYYVHTQGGHAGHDKLLLFHQAVQETRLLMEAVDGGGGAFWLKPAGKNHFIHPQGGTAKTDAKLLWNDATREARLLFQAEFVGSANSGVEIKPFLELMYGYDNGGGEPVTLEKTDVTGFTSARSSSSETKNTANLATEVSGSYGFASGFNLEAKVTAGVSHESSYGRTNSRSLSSTTTEKVNVTFPGSKLTEHYRWAVQLKGGHTITLPGSIMVFTNGKSRTGKTKAQIEAAAPPCVLTAA